jgi:hypothetical protein
MTHIHFSHFEGIVKRLRPSGPDVPGSSPAPAARELARITAGSGGDSFRAACVEEHFNAAQP